MLSEQVEGMISQLTNAPSKGGTSSGPLNLHPKKKRRAPSQIPSPLGLASNRPLEGGISFISADYEGKVVLI